ncbi:MAG TPA: DsbC family protein [Syntrophales bacterium]|nr:DsbC family protein [Syntrophales bacterium]
MSQTESDYETVKKTLVGLKIDTIRVVEGLDMYEVVSDNQAAYLTKDLRYFIVGRVFDMKDKRDLTADRINSLRRIDFAKLDKRDAIKMGDGGKALAVFTDLGCPYCKRLHGELSKLKDVTTYIYLYPLAAQNEEVKKKAASVLCADDKLAALNATWFGKVPPESVTPTEACIASVENNVRMGRGHRITSTPTLVLEDGRVVVGYKTEAEIRALLAAPKEGKNGK